MTRWLGAAMQAEHGGESHFSPRPPKHLVCLNRRERRDANRFHDKFAVKFESLVDSLMPRVTHHRELDFRAMISEPEAREAATGAFAGQEVVLGGPRELTEGWFFPCVMKGVPIYVGVVVNKATGRTLRVRTWSPMADDLTLYDRGYQFSAYDLVVLAVENFDEAVRVLHTLHFVTVDTYYKNDRVYRVGRGLTEAEVRDRLSRLPCVFSGSIDFGIDKLEHAREAGWFSFKVFEYRGKE